MSTHDLIVNYLGIFLRGITLAYSLIFVIRYSQRPWRALPEGRHLMGMSVVILLFMVLSFVNNLAAYIDDTPPTVRPDGNYPGRDYIALLLFAAIAFQMYRRNSLLLPDDGHENPEHPDVQKARNVVQHDKDVVQEEKDRVAGLDRDDVVDTKE